MSFKISNVKVSLKTSPISLDNVLDKFIELNMPLKNYKNFVVLKNKYTYTIFKTNAKSENHINITKIPNIEKIEKAIKHLKNFIEFSVKNVTIDNIIATLNMNRSIDLVLVCERKLFESIKYNNELFAGLFVKFEKGTAIIFHSGKIVLVGCKNIENLEWLTQNICAVIKTL